MSKTNKGHDNLIPMASRTEQERKAISSKGGKAKAEKERQRKAVAETFNTILSLEYDGEYTQEIKDQWGVGKLEINLQGQPILTGLCAKVVRDALRGNMKATEIILRYIEPNKE